MSNMLKRFPTLHYYRDAYLKTSLSDDLKSLWNSGPFFLLFCITSLAKYNSVSLRPPIPEQTNKIDNKASKNQAALHLVFFLFTIHCQLVTAVFNRKYA